MTVDAAPPDEPLPRTVSVGVACWQPGYADLTAEQLTQRADKAVYTAKESGRNRVMVARGFGEAPVLGA